MRANEFLTEKWSQKYKRSINCSHPNGFSQRAHCAGKKKHNESVEQEMTCPDCGMCETHGNMTLSEIKQRLDPKCWKGKHKEGTKIKGGVRVNNCVPNESVEEVTTPVDYTKFKLSRSSGEEEKYTVFNLFYNGKFVGDIGYLKADQNWFVGEPSGSAWGALNGKYHDNNRYATKDQALQALIKAVEPHLNLVAEELAEEFDLIEDIIENLAKHNGVDSEVIWEDLESLDDDELYVFATTTTIMETEAWQKANNRDKTDGMSRKAVKTYRREHPGSKLQTAVTTKPSKLKKGSKASKRRKSYCSRSRGQMKMHNISCAKTPDKAICKARRRWNC